MLSLLHLTLDTAIKESTHGDVRLLREDAEAILEVLQEFGEKEQEPMKLITCKDCIHNGRTDCPIKWDGKSDEDFCSFGFPEMLDEEATDTQWTIF